MEKKVVLVVTPNAKLLELARQLGASVGLEYITCENTTEAIELIRSKRVDLVAVEAFMDDNDVFSVIKAVRGLPEKLQKPIWVFAAEPGPVGTRFAPQAAAVAQLLGADRFDIAHVSDVPRLVAETRAALDQLQPGDGSR